LDSLSKLDDLIDANAELAEAIFMTGFRGFIAPTLDSEWVAKLVPEKYAHDEFKVYSAVMDHLNVKSTYHDHVKARSHVHQFYRDWSAEGAVERSKSFDPIVKALEDEFQSLSKTSIGLDKSDLTVLVPGAGLGRLCFDIRRAGFTVEGNEISYHALFASSLALNHTKGVGQYTLAPFALSPSNHLSRSDQFRTFDIPDIHPETELNKLSESGEGDPSGGMSMTTGDFTVIYNQPDARERYEAVATLFFIDTAPNIIRYVEVVRNCLVPGGIWINLGPLLWHHAGGAGPEHSHEGTEAKSDEETSTKSETQSDAGIGSPGSVELTEEEVIALVQHFGFDIEKHETDTFGTGYLSNDRSMLQSFYRPSFWIARKR
jgi:hypothetical protein